MRSSRCLASSAVAAIPAGLSGSIVRLFIVTMSPGAVVLITALRVLLRDERHEQRARRVLLG